MYNQPDPSDAHEIIYLVHFNNIFVSRYLLDFAQKIFSRLYNCRLLITRAVTKRDLKDVIIINPPYRTPRIDQLIADYQNNPSLYYPETPFHGTLFFCDGTESNRYIGSCRIKRIRRLAEKSARNIISWVFKTIKQQADELAEKRAQQLGVSHEELVTPPEEMAVEFSNAERRIEYKNLSVGTISVISLSVSTKNRDHSSIVSPPYDQFSRVRLSGLSSEPQR